MKLTANSLMILVMLKLTAGQLDDFDDYSRDDYIELEGIVETLIKDDKSIPVISKM